MDLSELLINKSIKPKVKTETVSQWLLEQKLSPADLISFAEKAKDPAKATCI